MSLGGAILHTFSNSDMIFEGSVSKLNRTYWAFWGWGPPEVLLFAKFQNKPKIIIILLENWRVFMKLICYKGIYHQMITVGFK